MKIKLAGYNVDRDVLNTHPLYDNMTPETLTAAYARISRAPDSVDMLRRKASENVAKARTSNENIIFKLGHASVAEHAVFNFDIEGVSRLAIEAIELGRLCSFTEKSQRYIKFDSAKKEFFVPSEVIAAGREIVFRDFVKTSFDAYHYILDKLKEQKRPQGGSAQEDARYVTPLAVTGQLGMTINARSLALMVRKLKSHNLCEVREIGQALFDEVKAVAPSLLCGAKPEPLRQNMLDKLQTALSVCVQGNLQDESPVTLLSAPRQWEGDVFILTSLVHQASHAPFAVCHAAVSKMTPETQFQLLHRLFTDMECDTAAPRQWEMTTMMFELICSASCFAQLKRHRMATILPQAYNMTLGIVTPEAICQDGSSSWAFTRFKAVMNASKALYDILYKDCGPSVAEYALTQAHRRRVLVSMNARELYVFSRLREDKHAQWDIRGIAHQMMDIARKVMPLTMALACGKDRFEQRQALFSETQNVSKK